MRCDERLLHPGWRKFATGAIRGTPFLGQSPLAAEHAVRQASGALVRGELTSLVARWNGFFSIVVWGETRVGLAVDRARSMPLFYSSNHPVMAVSDSAEWVKARIGNPPVDPVSALEFLLAGHVLNDGTLCKGVCQVQSGESVQCDWIPSTQTWNYAASRYRLFRPLGTGELDYHVQLDRYLDTLTLCFSRALRFAGTRQIVVPLSGGYDSRLLLLMLVRLGRKKILAYTYGRSSAEVERSRLIASATGVAWQLCDYSPAAWREAAHGQQFQRYLRDASNLSGVACIQEWLAVRQLRKARLVDSDALFMPGYAADLPAGSFLSYLGPKGRSALRSREAFEEMIWRDRLVGWPRSGIRDDMNSKIASELKRSIDALAPVDSWPQAYDSWLFSETVPKFTVNAVRAFDLQNFDWWLPFFDGDFLSFWEQVPMSFRLGERLHCDCTDRLYQELTGSEPPSRPRIGKYNGAEVDSIASGIRHSARHVARLIYRSPLCSQVQAETRAWAVDGRLPP